MSIFISALEIENYRNFRHLKLESFPRGAVIVGENGSGKSNLLRAIRLVLDPTLPDSARQLQVGDFWRDAFLITDRPIVKISLELSGFDIDTDAKSVLSKCILPGSPYRARLTYRFAPNSSVTDEPDAADTEQITLNEYDFEIYGGDDSDKDASRIKRDIGLKVLEALRDAETDLLSWRKNPLRGLLEATPLDEENLQTTAEAMAEAAAQLREDKAIPTLETDIRGRLENMAGARLPIKPSLGFISSAPDELVRAIRLFIDTDLRHPIADASLGSANVLYLALLLELLSKQRASAGHVETLLAVEEPEAHLHVALQRRLFRYLLRTGSAPVLTTHSPHIASVAPVNSIVLLRESPDGSRGTTTAGLTYTSDEAADIERYLDVTRAEILFASFVIFVEGISELYVLPALAEAAGFDLDGHGVVIASIHGTDFAPYAKLLGSQGLDIPFAIVTDGDAAADGNGRTEAGLRRAMRLIDPDDSTGWKDGIHNLSGLSAQRYLEVRSTYIDAAMESGIFVSSQTLETDLATLFSAEIRDAFQELSSVTNARADVSSGLANEALASPNLDLRKQYLKRISALGKGRFAQRLAAHIENADLNALAPAATAPDGSVSADYGTAQYLFAVLQQASVAVRDADLRSARDNFGE